MTKCYDFISFHVGMLSGFFVYKLSIYISLSVYFLHPYVIFDRQPLTIESTIYFHTLYGHIFYIKKVTIHRRIQVTMSIAYEMWIHMVFRPPLYLRCLMMTCHLWMMRAFATYQPFWSMKRTESPHPKNKFVPCLLGTQIPYYILTSSFKKQNNMLAGI